MSKITIITSISATGRPRECSTLSVKRCVHLGCVGSTAQLSQTATRDVKARRRSRMRMSSHPGRRISRCSVRMEVYREKADSMKLARARRRGQMKYHLSLCQHLHITSVLEAHQIAQAKLSPLISLRRARSFEFTDLTSFLDSLTEGGSILNWLMPLLMMTVKPRARASRVMERRRRDANR